MVYPCQSSDTTIFCSEGNTKKMEKVQERALMFVYEDFSSCYEDILKEKKQKTNKNKKKKKRFTKFTHYRLFLE